MLAYSRDAFGGEVALLASIDLFGSGGRFRFNPSILHGVVVANVDLILQEVILVGLRLCLDDTENRAIR
jgi:hypothetical protein